MLNKVVCPQIDIRSLRPLAAYGASDAYMALQLKNGDRFIFVTLILPIQTALEYKK